MKGLRAGLAAVPLMAGAASAAERLNDAQLDTVTAGAALIASSQIVAGPITTDILIFRPNCCIDPIIDVVQVGFEVVTTTPNITVIVSKPPLPPAGGG
jgi:hypothetical protein